MEHIIPVSSGGGTVAYNVVPSCHSCNRFKHTGVYHANYAELAAHVQNCLIDFLATLPTKEVVRKNTAISVSKLEREGYINIEDAGKALGVGRTTLYYYARLLGIQTQKFPLDRKTYISRADLERIQEAKKAAAEGRH